MLVAHQDSLLSLEFQLAGHPARDVERLDVDDFAKAGSQRAMDGESTVHHRAHDAPPFPAGAVSQQPQAGDHWRRALVLSSCLVRAIVVRPVFHPYTSTDFPSVSTNTAPSRAVLNIATPLRVNLSTTTGAGWPNRLFRPALKITAAGSTAAMNGSLLDVALPWCAAFRTTSGASVSRGMRSRSTSLPISPGSRIETVAVAEFDHDGVIVAHALPLPVRRGWMHDPDLDAPGALDVAGQAASARRCGARRQASQAAETSMRRDGNALPHVRDRNSPQDSLCSIDMIGIPMCHDQRMQRDAHPARAGRARQRGHRCRSWCPRVLPRRSGWRCRQGGSRRLHRPAPRRGRPLAERRRHAQRNTARGRRTTADQQRARQRQSRQPPAAGAASRSARPRRAHSRRRTATSLEAARPSTSHGAKATRRDVSTSAVAA